MHLLRFEEQGEHGHLQLCYQLSLWCYGLQAQYPPLCLSLAVLDVAVVVGPIREASPRVLVDETGAPDSVTALLRKNCCCLCTLCSCCPLAADA